MGLACLEADPKRPSRNDTDSWIEFNTKARTAVHELLALPQSFVVPGFIVMIINTNLCCRLMAQAVNFSGLSWDKKVEKDLAGEDGAAKKPRYRITEVQSVTATFWATAEHQFFQEEAWNLILIKCRGYGSRALAFASTIKACGAIWYNIDRFYRGFPYRLFRLLTVVDHCVGDEENSKKAQEELAGQILSEARCRPHLDSFSDEFLTRYNTVPLLTSTDATMTLATIALNWRCDIQRIESRQASLKRYLALKGATWTRELMSLSADFILMMPNYGACYSRSCRIITATTTMKVKIPCPRQAGGLHGPSILSGGVPQRPNRSSAQRSGSKQVGRDIGRFKPNPAQDGNG